MRGFIQRNKLAWSACLAVGLMAVQLGALRMAPSAGMVRVVLPLTIALVPLALWPHRQRVGVWVMLVGLTANLAAITLNGGLMPIRQSTVVEAVGVERAAAYREGAWIEGSKDVLVADGDGLAVALGDSIVVRVGDGGFVASPGDVVVWAGLLVLAAEASLAWQRRGREAPPRQLAAAEPGTAATSGG